MPYGGKYPFNPDFAGVPDGNSRHDAPAIFTEINSFFNFPQNRLKIFLRSF